MLFFGIDLAWSVKNKTGVSVLEGDKKKGELLAWDTAFSDSEIIDFIKNYAGDDPAFIAIDAPLIVPNEKGRREADSIVSQMFRKYDAGAYPANRSRFLNWTGRVRGEEISALLEEENFIQHPFCEKFEETRKFFEVYPHPSMVVLFGLPKILKYKAKPKRDYDFRWNEFRKYQKFLLSLEEKDPALYLPPEITERKLKGLRGKALKKYEDILDSVFCAYIAYYFWKNPAQCAVLGSMKEGYILTPVF